MSINIANREVQNFEKLVGQSKLMRAKLRAWLLRSVKPGYLRFYFKPPWKLVMLQFHLELVLKLVHLLCLYLLSLRSGLVDLMLS